MTDHEKLRTALALIRDWLARATFHSSALVKYDFDQICDAAESTLPKTKMVEVWRVEYAYHNTISRQTLPDIRTFESETAARAWATFDGVGHCIRVTGPHQQEVPA